MSTVVGIIDNGKILMGADSYATTEDGARRRIVCKKIFVNGPYLIGFVGSLRAGQIISSIYFDPPDNIYKFPQKLIEQFREYECLCTSSDDQTCYQDTNFLIATSNGKLFEILGDFQLSEVKDYTAIGSGTPYALGSLHTSRKSKNQKLRIMSALKASGVYDTSTGPPYTIEEFLN